MHKENSAIYLIPVITLYVLELYEYVSTLIEEIYLLRTGYYTQTLELNIDTGRTV